MRLVGKFRFALLTGTLVLVLSAAGGPGAPRAVAADAIAGHLTKTSFTAAQAKSVKLTYTISKRSKSFAYSLSIKSGSKYKLIKKVTKKGSFNGRRTMTMSQVFAGKTIKVGSYRLTLSADKGQRTLAFKVADATIPIPNPGATPPPAPPAASPPLPPPPPAAYSHTSHITAWYSSYSSASYGYIHFKCVDEATGVTVEEVLGSDSIDFNAETQAVLQTPARVELVNQLTAKLQSEGWHQIGTVSGGEWYQLRFGR
jgi:hypothetical protein